MAQREETFQTMRAVTGRVLSNIVAMVIPTGRRWPAECDAIWLEITLAIGCTAIGPKKATVPWAALKLDPQ